MALPEPVELLTAEIEVDDAAVRLGDDVALLEPVALPTGEPVADAESEWLEEDVADALPVGDVVDDGTNVCVEDAEAVDVIVAEAEPDEVREALED